MQENKAKSTEDAKSSLQPLEIEEAKVYLIPQTIPSKEVTIDDIVRAIPFGRFQILMIIIFFLIYTAPSIVVYNYAYFLMQPKYLCTYPDLTVKTCSVEEMCEMQNQVSSREEYIKEVDWSAPESLSNWIYRLNLECSETYKIGLFGTFEFCG